MREEASLEYVPSDIMMDIISRLPFKTITSCKCVCKSWLNLLTSPEFVKCHLSKSKPALVFSQYEDDNHKIPPLYHVVELESYNTISAFGHLEFSGFREGNYMSIEGSVDGLMFCLMVSNRRHRSYSYYIFNPVTREYIELPLPQVRDFKCYQSSGFGLCKMNRQYKMVRISFSVEHNHLMYCEVYTLGTRSWRTIPFAATDVAPLKYCITCRGATDVFSNGDVLMELLGGRLLYYSSKRKTGGVVHISEPPTLHSYFIGILHSPSFLPLKKSFVTEDVKLLHSSGSTSNRGRKLKFHPSCFETGKERSINQK